MSSAPERVAEASPAPRRRAARSVAFGGTLFNFWTMAAAAECIMSVWDTRSWVAHCVSGGTVAGLSVACNVRPTRLLLDLQRAVEGCTTSGRAPRMVEPRLLREAFDRALPRDAHRLCAGRLVLYVIKVGGLDIQSVSEFPSRGDLLDACVAAMSLPGLNMSGVQTVGGIPAMDVATTLIPYTDLLRRADLFVALGPAAPRGAHVVVSPLPSTPLRPPTDDEARQQVLNARRAVWQAYPALERGMRARGFAPYPDGPRWPDVAPPGRK